jgi:hypothetical protein
MSGMESLRSSASFAIEALQQGFASRPEIDVILAPGMGDLKT